MYKQFFGNFLLANDYVTKDQLFSAMQKMPKETIKVATIAMHAGLITSSDVMYIRELMTSENKTFSELATEQGYLTNEQVLELLNTDTPDYLILAQVLVDNEAVSVSDMESYVLDYRSRNEIYDLDMATDHQENIDNLFNNFFIASETPISNQGKMFFELMYSDFLHHIGDDFTLLPPSRMPEFPASFCVSQKINGDYSVSTYLNMDKDVAIEFASRYAGESFFEFDEYVEASLDDFLNLHNGLFVANCSNEYSLELTLSTLEHITDSFINFEDITYYFPVLFSFGQVDFLLEVHKLI